MAINSIKEKQVPSRSTLYREKQRGVVLFIALIVLIAMSLAGVSMMRAVDTGTQVAGNLATKQNVVNAPDAAFEFALSRIVQMVATGTSSGNTSVVGYSAVDNVQQVDERQWNTAQDLGTNSISGLRSQLLIDRICTPAGDCERTAGPAGSAEGRDFGKPGAGIIPFYQHFRSIVQVTDAKGLVNHFEFKND
jgi:Tfp pilus assembly protein PilX